MKEIEELRKEQERKRTMTPMTQKLLVIDDEKSLTELLSDHFRETLRF